MKSLKDYQEIYGSIAANLGLTGEGVEMIKQMLAYSSYIEEVENLGLVQESSLERARLTNSKIQHCMDQMYSVFRGSCPRVILNFKATTRLDLKPFDHIITSQNFKVYYLGYWDGTRFEYSGISIPADLGIGEPKEWRIIGFISPEVVEKSWTLSKNNLYYVDCLESWLSNDVEVWISGPSEDPKSVEVTRSFSSHISGKSVFDLTIQDYGSRLYVQGLPGVGESSIVRARYYKLNYLSSYPEAELNRLRMNGTEPLPFPADANLVEPSPGISFIEGVAPEASSYIHYHANRDRYTNQLLRSNSDIGTVLEEAFPDKISKGGTKYGFTGDKLSIWYIPKPGKDRLTNSEKSKFKKDHLAYYVTPDIDITEGTKYKANLQISCNLFKDETIESEVSEVLSEYANKFGIVFNEQTKAEIQALISKIPNVKRIIDITPVIVTNTGQVISDPETISGFTDNEVYYDITHSITTIL